MLYTPDNVNKGGHPDNIDKGCTPWEPWYTPDNSGKGYTLLITLINVMYTLIKPY